MSRYKSINYDKANGVVYTPAVMAEYLADEMMLADSQTNLKSIRILDPAIGDGVLAVALLDRLKEIDCSISLIGFETDNNVALKTRENLTMLYPNVNVQIHCKNFIEYTINNPTLQECSNINYVIANPPYIRTQILGADKAQELSAKLGLNGRVDIYYAFMMLAEKMLASNGIAGFITSNKFMSVKSGSQLRSYLIENTTLRKIVDFGDTHLFDAAVLPCIIVFKKATTKMQEPTFTAIYECDFDACAIEAENVFKVTDNAGVYKLPNGNCYRVKTGRLSNINNSSDIWTIATDDIDLWLQMVSQKTWKTFSEIGKIRVGIKTTADNVFIGNDWVERTGNQVPELLHPLITHRNAGQIIASNNDHWEVLYTHQIVDGKKCAYDMTLYPKSLDYLKKHKKQLASRKYIQEAKRNWYEIWVPQNPEIWQDMKIVFRDIAAHPTFWLDQSGAIVNGDCYWIDIFQGVEMDIVALALAVANSKFIEDFYDIKFNNKLYSGKRRYMTQYVSQFPIPNPKTDEAQRAISIVKKILNDNKMDQTQKENLDDLVKKMFTVS
ncbi:Eco57I restriction-modification methylase domain-containing protein [Hydrogenoanaerobacterium sp.]|uniref:Eco57I restriction-modification methylase domain-containing protein n=1 Tax=Hydrogenoanaerobacterium sp. TaxID=2953763 RepID=UPI0028A24AAB|nr:N-6 DNA methylase [Hydrogenoanaerobacterium sp.]